MRNGMGLELADAKAGNDALRDGCRWSSSGLISKQSVSQCKKPPRLAKDNAASPDWQTLHRTGLFHPQREADHYAKTTEGTQKYINEQCR